MNVLHRSRIGLAILGLLSATACSEDAPRSEPVRVTSASTSPSTIDPGTTSTSVNAPVPTKPLTTAPPSELLTEITAVYDAAYSDLLAAEAIPDEHYAKLGDHMTPKLAEHWRQTLSQLRSSGLKVRQMAGTERWKRVERIELDDETHVAIVVCRFDPDEAIDAAGAVAQSDAWSYRVGEAFEFSEGTWKWSERTDITRGPSRSECGPS